MDKTKEVLFFKPALGYSRYQRDHLKNHVIDSNSHLVEEIDQPSTVVTVWISEHFNYCKIKSWQKTKRNFERCSGYNFF